ncbi:MAG: hypothetical protein K0U76_07670, partial [Actinomycetia bacterium]|nr:hypothetical protein [Actinomycetes bacterium]
GIGTTRESHEGSVCKSQTPGEKTQPPHQRHVHPHTECLPVDAPQTATFSARSPDVTTGRQQM